LGCSATSIPAEEQRCKDLGANCVCSEPFNTNLLRRIEPSWFDPVDGVRKECSTSRGGAPIERNANDVAGSNDTAALNALPAGHQVSYFARGPEGHLGIFFAGNRFGRRFITRGAARWYLYHSPNFEFAGDGGCQNSKLAQFDGGALLDKSFGFVHMYNFTTWSPPQDCCLSGPGPDNVAKADWRGKWWRIEVIFSNRAGGNPGFVGKVYIQNVTDNRPELLVVDTSWPGTQLIPSSTRTPPDRIDTIWMNNYRQNACAGWLGFSHYMMAGWDIDAGQRIGPAIEIERLKPSPRGAS
jgi:hypothetical protein